MAELARKYVKVVLTGEGADELFGGYQYIWTLYRTANVERLPGWLRQGLALSGRPLRRMPPHHLTRRAAHVLSTFPLEFSERYRSVVSSLDGSSLSNLIGPALESGLTEVSADEVEMELPPARSNVDRLDWLLEALFTTWLPDDLLMKVDKMTMAVGLEARAPFLDHQLVETVARMPSQLKIRGITRKYLLRRLAGELLPARVAQRPKHGFEPPIDSWLRGTMRTLLFDTLSGRSLEQAGWLDVEAVRGLAAAHDSGRGNFGFQLWTILCFQLWFDHFVRAGSAVVGCSSEPDIATI
jgi:asparagine synthase (glutamine-hydrolysing)